MQLWKCANVASCGQQVESPQVPIGWHEDTRFGYQERRTVLACSTGCLDAFWASQPPPATPPDPE